MWKYSPRAVEMQPHARCAYLSLSEFACLFMGTEYVWIACPSHKRQDAFKTKVRQPSCRILAAQEEQNAQG